MSRRALAALSVALLSATEAHAAPQSCAGLAALSLADTTIDHADIVPAGSFALPDPQLPGARPQDAKSVEGLPAFCRVTGSIAPTSDSDIKFEVWLPAKDWNGRFEGVGNGGLAGYIAYPALAEALRRGYAAASTDTGHIGSAANFALGHPQRVIDYGYRAIHEVAVKGKAVVQAFYSRPPNHSYFQGCSNGGRAALMEAQRYPDDYEGIIAGAPANKAMLSNVVEIVNLDIATVDALNPNLSAFKQRGGKLIHYHGEADQNISPETSVDYFESVERLAGGGDADQGARRTAEFYRMFMVPEMGHCGGGPEFTGAALTALENWVERGQAPDRLVTAYNVHNIPEPVQLICPYPATAHWSGRGNPHDPETSVCAVGQ